MNECPRLECWSVSGDRLVGYVHGHPKFDDGTSVITSEIRRMDLAAGWAETRTRTYALGDSAPAGTVCAKEDI